MSLLSNICNTVFAYCLDEKYSYSSLQCVLITKYLHLYNISYFRAISYEFTRQLSSVPWTLRKPLQLVNPVHYSSWTLSSVRGLTHSNCCTNGPIKSDHICRDIKISFCTLLKCKTYCVYDKSVVPLLNIVLSVTK